VFEVVARDHVDRAGGGEIALVGEVGSLGDLHSLDHLGDDEVGVGETLAVRVRHQVDRHPVDGQRQVGAVVGVEAAKEILIRLATARMLDDQQSWRDAQDVLHAADRPQLKIAILKRERRRCADRF
jgi:hypothetical protein